jgi:uncharacterized membrane protein YqjE
MESAAPKTRGSSASQSLQTWLASLIDYLELRIRLLGLESREAGVHLLSLALLLASALTLFVGFLVMLVVFLFFLLMLIFGWAWGWSALALGGASLILSIIVAIIFRIRLAVPLFEVSISEFQKDQEWLTQAKKSSD